jgi:hypothetical protein
MKTPSWLKKQPNDTKLETRKQLRQRTDQRLKQWEVQKDQRDGAENSRVNGVHKGQ